MSNVTKPKVRNVRSTLSTLAFGLTFTCLILTVLVLYVVCTPLRMVLGPFFRDKGTDA